MPPVSAHWDKVLKGRGTRGGKLPHLPLRLHHTSNNRRQNLRSGRPAPKTRNCKHPSNLFLPHTNIKHLPQLLDFVFNTLNTSLFPLHLHSHTPTARIPYSNHDFLSRSIESHWHGMFRLFPPPPSSCFLYAILYAGTPACKAAMMFPRGPMGVPINGDCAMQHLHAFLLSRGCGRSLRKQISD